MPCLLAALALPSPVFTLAATLDARPFEFDTTWLTNYDVSIKNILDPIVEQTTRPLPTSSDPYMADWRVRAKSFIRLAEESWKAIFFCGMRELALELASAYSGPCSTFRIIKDRLATAEQLLRLAADRTRHYLEQYADWGTAEVHRQLSFYAGEQHTKFDPIELLFAVRIHREYSATAQDDLIRKALAIVLETQRADGSWAGDAPFSIDKNSSAGVYVSALEAMTALVPLIRAYGLAEHRHEHLERMYRWLRTMERRITIPRTVFGWPDSKEPSNRADPEISGWSNDRLNDPERIDVWMSGLALQFMAQYDDLLQDILKSHARERYNLKEPASRAWPLEDLTDAQLEVSEAAERIREQILARCVRPFQNNGRNEFSSLLLYGPPGTSKSTIAEAIAKSLKWSLLTITPSDFVKEGIERSEHCARLVFDDLLRLQKVVVFFDEIDEMLRSRALPSVEGAGMLRFIVPAMLPRLQEVKKYGETAPLIIVIATNYADRLDPAITRAGRIDDGFLLMPPDGKARERHLRRELKQAFRLNEAELRNAAKDLADRTSGWTVAELRSLVGKINLNYRGGEGGRGFADWLARQTSPVHADDVPEQLAALSSGSQILGLTRALKLLEWYRDRPGAKEEAAKVLRICAGAESILLAPIDNTRKAAEILCRGSRNARQERARCDELAQLMS